MKILKEFIKTCMLIFARVFKVHPKGFLITWRFRLKHLGFRSAWPKDSKISHSKGVNVFGFHSTNFGLGVAARAIASGLEESGIPLQTCSITVEQLKSTNKTLTHGCHGINIVNINPTEVGAAISAWGREDFCTQYNIAYWFWETNLVPGYWKIPAVYFDEIWVATSFVRDAILARGIDKEVFVIPMCLEEPSFVNSDIRKKYDIPKEAKIFSVMFDMSSYALRKNPLATIEAIKNACEDRDDCFIFLKIRKPDVAPVIYTEVLDSLKDTDYIIVEQQMDKAEIYSIMRESTALVSLHRSEGFGLFLAEAMQCGCPVVATGYSGNMDFMNEANSYPVQYKIIKNIKATSDYNIGIQWAEPDIDHATESLKEILADNNSVAQKTTLAKKTIKQMYSSNKVKEILSQRINEIWDKSKKKQSLLTPPPTIDD